jgi:hypothetical protein
VTRSEAKSIARAWAVIRRGLTPVNRREFADAAYEAVHCDYSALGDIAREAGVDRAIVRGLVEDAAERAWLAEWTKFDGKPPPRSETHGAAPQSPPLSAAGGRNPDKSSTRPMTQPPECPGCGNPLTGKRQGAKYHNDACRKRAQRAAL